LARTSTESTSNAPLLIAAHEARVSSATYGTLVVVIFVIVVVLEIVSLGVGVAHGGRRWA